jgi:hypothetical protein
MDPTVQPPRHEFRPNGTGDGSTSTDEPVPLHIRSLHSPPTDRPPERKADLATEFGHSLDGFRPTVEGADNERSS